MSERFGKAKLKAWAEARMASADRAFREETRRSIDPGNGTAQCRGQSHEAWLHYGEWSMALNIIQSMNWGDL